MSKEAYYFSHDSNAKTDEKVLELRAEFGWEGYGLYWAIIEYLRDSEGYKYSVKRLSGLALSLGIEKSKLERIIFNFDLFAYDEENFWSERLLRTMQKREELSRKRAEFGAMAKGKQGKNKDKEEHKQGISSAFAEQGKEIKGKEIKGKEIESKENLKEKENTTIPTNDAAEKSATRKKIEVSQDGIEFAEEFRKTLPHTQIVTESDLKNWAITFDELIRIDKRPKDEIYKVVQFARNDSFWKGNFLSANKLRNKDSDGIRYYDRFLTQSKVEYNGKPTKPINSRGVDDLSEYADKWAARLATNRKT